MLTMNRETMLWILLLSVLCQAEGKFELEDNTLYLNSPNHCKGKIIYVHRNATYHVSEDVSPNSRTNSVRNCKLTFTSDSRLCFRQEGNLTEIAADKVKLYVHSGSSHEDDDELLLTYEKGSRDGISYAERCLPEGKDFLSFHLEISPHNVDISELRITLTVQTIDNPTRYAYFSTYFNGFDYELQNSMFTIFNRPEVYPPQFYGLDNEEFLTGKNFKLKKVSGSNRTLCFYYKPLVDFTCVLGWRIAILESVNDVLTSRWMIDCNSQAVTAKCFTPVLQEVIVALKRGQDIDSYDSSVPELPHMFMLVASDYTSSNTQDFLGHVESTFRNLVPPEHLPGTVVNPVIRTIIGTGGHSKTSAGTLSVHGLSITWIIVIAVVSLLVIICVAFAFCRHRQRKMSREDQESTQDGTHAAVEEEPFEKL